MVKALLFGFGCLLFAIAAWGYFQLYTAKPNENTPPMTIIDWLYNRDPNKYKNAERIERIGWRGFRKIVGDKWTPGMNIPFDPIATRLAQKSGMRLVLLGKKLLNLKKFLDGKKFEGSIIE